MIFIHKLLRCILSQIVKSIAVLIMIIISILDIFINLLTTLFTIGILYFAYNYLQDRSLFNLTSLLATMIASLMLLLLSNLGKTIPEMLYRIAYKLELGDDSHEI